MIPVDPPSDPKKKITAAQYVPSDPKSSQKSSQSQPGCKPASVFDGVIYFGPSRYFVLTECLGPKCSQNVRVQPRQGGSRSHHLRLVTSHLSHLTQPPAVKCIPGPSKIPLPVRIPSCTKTEIKARCVKPLSICRQTAVHSPSNLFLTPIQSRVHHESPHASLRALYSTPVQMKYIASVQKI
jgi:hypothetical protein